jgi:dihydrofolate synthase/folylpolyglutamate synthase
MNYAETLEYLFSKLPMYSRIGAAAYKTDLHNTIALLEHIGNPHQSIRTIHIAGTNGKGSVSHMLAAILQAAGYKTGLYTSPHLKDFRERIRIDGTMIPEHTVIDFTESIRPAIEEIEPSFFELTVAMAFDHFAKAQVDIAVIETGLGGRLDSTNVINPELSIITNIGWDHMNLLGDTLGKIAFEKAGIIKKNTPVVVGEQIPETMPVFLDKAQNMQAPLTWSGTNYRIQSHRQHSNRLIAEVIETGSIHTSPYSLDLTGIYQLKNLLTVLESVNILQAAGWNISDHALRSALDNVKTITGFSGRWEVLQNDPMLVLDVAHNTHGLAQVLEQLRLTPHKKLHIVLGMVNDKQIDDVLRMLPTSANYYFTQASIPRALPSHLLKEQAMAVGLEGLEYRDVNNAIEEALKRADPNDLILVTGSIFLVGEVRR